MKSRHSEDESTTEGKVDRMKELRSSAQDELQAINKMQERQRILDENPAAFNKTVYSVFQEKNISGLEHLKTDKRLGAILCVENAISYIQLCYIHSDHTIEVIHHNSSRSIIDDDTLAIVYGKPVTLDQIHNPVEFYQTSMSNFNEHAQVEIGSEGTIHIIITYPETNWRMSLWINSEHLQPVVMIGGRSGCRL